MSKLQPAALAADTGKLIQYWPGIRKVLLSPGVHGQDKTNGNWSGETGTVYATSMALIMLQVPNRLLPILQK